MLTVWFSDPLFGQKLDHLDYRRWFVWCRSKLKGNHHHSVLVPPAGILYYDVLFFNLFALFFMVSDLSPRCSRLRGAATSGRLCLPPRSPRTAPQTAHDSKKQERSNDMLFVDLFPLMLARSSV